MSEDHKQDIIDALEKMRKKETADKNPFKARAYAKVIKQLKEMEKPVHSIDDLKDVQGIGEKIHIKIKEIIETGTLKQAEQYNLDPKFKIMEEFLKIHAIGPAKARELVEKHNIDSIEKLKEHQELLNEKQKMGLKYYGEFDLRIPRKEMDVHNQYIQDTIHAIEPSYVVQLAGSYRRKEKDSGDIDVLITYTDAKKDHDTIFKTIIDRFQKEKYICDIFAQGNKKCLAVCRAKRHHHYRRIDLMITEPHVFPFALLYFTGSANFNVEMRNYCLEKGYSMSEYGLKYTSGKKEGEFVEHEFKTEEDIFAFLGLKYVEPENRKTKMVEKLN